MSNPQSKWLHIFFICFLTASLSACDKISIPRLSFDEKPETKIPISIIYHFDPTLSQHSKIVDACGLPYTIPSGDIITQTFLKVGQDHFVAARTQPKTTTNPAENPSNALTVDLNFIAFNFDPIGRSGEEDRYNVNVGLQLQAIYQDPQGNALAQTPLTYSETTRLWTPALSSQSSSCATGQFDAVVENAAETLALEMVNVLPQLYGQAPQPPGTTRAEQSVQIPTQAIPVQSASLAFRTMLQDANDNLVLEGGEHLSLQIETTNRSATPLPSAYVELRGSQDIVDAFTQVTPMPISIGPLQPGETKTTEVRGKMPIEVEEKNGKLVVSISLSQGIPPGSHTILAAIQRSSSATVPTVTEMSKPLSASPKKKNPQKASHENSPYHAMIIGLDEYRDPWPQAHQIPQEDLHGLTDTLKATGLFPDMHIKVLKGTHATRTDIEEQLVSLAKHQLTPDSIFFLYYSGHAFVAPENGEVYLVPYEGSPTASKKRLISLRSLQRVLHKFKAKLTLLFLDTPVTQYLEATGKVVGLKKSTPANWRAMIPVDGQISSTRIIQIRRLQGESNRDPAQLLAGLLGGSDQNQNGTVTLGELLRDLEETADIIPSQTQYLPFADIPLAQ